ncbi:DUF6390 family protein [Nocardia sp. NPDC024068]|uniref:DUF6390 family protein n=1 Tax=Nocardia sp. NPDC024068 TaxID=3157197 RepID=UPI0033D1262B
MNARGAEIFARFAAEPNRLGYCGPAGTTALRDGSPAEIRAVARTFTGAWPYLRVMSRMTGIGDPLDERLVESYWLGGGIGSRLDRAGFVAGLLAVIGPAAGHYWNHLTDGALADEAAPNHCFHVFGIYPWTRLLGRGGDQPLRVLDNCRISWGTVRARADDHLVVDSPRLEFDGRRLRLAAPETRRIPVGIDDFPALSEAAPGERVALHWDRICGRLTPVRAYMLAATTEWQLRATNRRLMRSPAPAPLLPPA